jgi:ATP-dependent Clp protease ATP-binding subunit ClpC
MDEGLVYTPVAAIGQPHSAPVPKKVRARALKEDIDAMRNKVKRLIALAERRNMRGDEGVEPESAMLSSHALPPGGFLDLLGEENHPHFNALLDVAAEIPWEALGELCLVCKNQPPHRRTVPKDVSPEDRFYCSHGCGEMTVVRRRLVEDYHLTHCVYNGGKVAVGGRRFLFVVDPRGNLFNQVADPDHSCEQHCEELRLLLEQRGFEIVLRRQESATVRAVLSLISDASVAGVYYFGHGDFSEKKGEGFLYLADGELTASEIEEAEPKARFVFLNACSAGHSGGNFDNLDKRSRSVAHAFAKGQGKVVIAPIFPVLNTHAASSALHFFRQTAKNPMGEALKSVRDISWTAYQEHNLPDICWLAYRYFGDPNTSLFAAKEVYADESAALPIAASRIFAAAGVLNSEVFSFAAADVWQAATDRRKKQGRTRLTPMDLLVGLIRKGDLTRFVFRQEGVDDLDTLCSALEERQDNGPKGFHKDLPNEIAGTQRKDFSDELVSILEKADKSNGGFQISEQDLLHALVDGNKWAVENDFGLPSAAGVLRRLRERGRAGIDDNGVVSLNGLDSDARNVIEIAHALSQQRGMPEIPNRLVMAALVANEKGFGARVCRCAGVNPELLCFVMIALAEGNDFDGKPRTFSLGPEVCKKIVTPVLHKARQLAVNSAVEEEHLFRAFAEVASPGFKEWVREFSADIKLEETELGKVDLDLLGQIDPEFWEKEMEGIDGDALDIIRSAHALSQDCGVFPITHRLLLAAFLSSPEGLLPNLLRRRNISAEALKAQLIAASDSGSQRKFPLNGEACRRAVAPVLEKARRLAEGQPVSGSVLFRAFCEVAPPELKQALRAPAFAVDLDSLAKEALISPITIEGPNSESTVAAPPFVSPNTTSDWDLHPFRADQFDAGAWRAIQEAARLAKQQGWSEIRSPHLLVALVSDPSGAIAKMLQALRANAADIQKMALSMLPAPTQAIEASSIRFGVHARQLISSALEMAGRQGHTTASADDLFMTMCIGQDAPIATLLQALGADVRLAGLGGAADFAAVRNRSALATFGVDLTEKARQGQLPEIVGREEEINTALQTLLLIENANPLLVGEAGVGKTAIVEGIARRIVNGPCPKKLQSMRIIELSSASLVANTRLRGEFEQRIQDVLAEAHAGVILFLDEIHTIMGAGSADGSGLDAGNMLKTALSRGDIRLIGATTHTEFKRTIALDKALSRRFQTQIIGPPSREGTILVLTARQAALEKHHDVKISEEAKMAAVDLSGRYIVDKQWPAKARDVLERACVVAATEGLPPVDGGAPQVTAENVAKVVSRWTGVPLERLSASDSQSLANLEHRLASRIIGQSEAIHIVADAIRRGRQGIAGRNRPWGVFLFVGPPGVGKTELAKVIGEEVFGGVEGLIRFDMGDFSEPHSTAKLIGAPPGYVGYQQGAPLVERLRTHPHSLLLFDEIEHAHENVLAVLLRLLSEGTLSDQDGNLADGRNCIIVFTSNMLGRGDGQGKVGFTGGLPVNSSQVDLRELLGRRLPRKMIDRLDWIVQFSPLAVDSLRELLDWEITARRAQMEATHGITVDVTAGVVGWLLGRVSATGQGARAVQRTVGDTLGTALAAALSKPRPNGAGRLVVRAPDGVDALEAYWEAGHTGGSS